MSRNDSNNSNEVNSNENDWAKAADNADKKAQEEFDKIKREAREEFTNGKFHNPDDDDNED